MSLFNSDNFYAAKIFVCALGKINDSSIDEFVKKRQFSFDFSWQKFLNRLVALRNHAREERNSLRIYIAVIYIKLTLNKVYE